jgi:hypothetical protein
MFFLESLNGTYPNTYITSLNNFRQDGTSLEKFEKLTFMNTWYSGIGMGRMVTPMGDVGTITCIN